MTETSVQPAQTTETPNVDPDLLEDIIDAVDEKDTRWLARTLQRMHPADAADALALAITHIWRGGAQARLEQAVARSRGGLRP